MNVQVSHFLLAVLMAPSAALAAEPTPLWRLQVAADVPAGTKISDGKNGHTLTGDMGKLEIAKSRPGDPTDVKDSQQRVGNIFGENIKPIELADGYIVTFEIQKSKSSKREFRITGYRKIGASEISCGGDSDNAEQQATQVATCKGLVAYETGEPLRELNPSCLGVGKNFARYVVDPGDAARSKEAEEALRTICSTAKGEAKNKAELKCYMGAKTSLLAVKTCPKEPLNGWVRATIAQLKEKNPPAWPAR